MKKLITILLLTMLSAITMAGEIGLPMERLAIKDLSGDHLVCIWDHDAGDWLGEFVEYDLSGIYDFDVPAWGKWYWIGVWDVDANEYVFGKWMGHFLCAWEDVE